MNRIIIIVLLSALFVGTWCFPQEMASTTRSATEGSVGAGRNGTDSSSSSPLSMTMQVESTMSTMVANNGTNTKEHHGKKHDKKAKHHHEKRSITTQQMKKKGGKGGKGKKSKTQSTTGASTE